MGGRRLSENMLGVEVTPPLWANGSSLGNDRNTTPGGSLAHASAAHHQCKLVRSKTSAEVYVVICTVRLERTKFLAVSPGLAACYLNFFLMFRLKTSPDPSS